MKRVLRLAAVFLLAALVFSGCGTTSSFLPEASPPSVVTGGGNSGAGAEIALIGLVEQAETPMWQAVLGTISWFAGEEGTTYGPYKTTAEETGFTVDLAVKGGAKVVVLLGAEMGDVLQQAQKDYPAVRFVLVDAQGNEALLSNSAAIRFASEQAGWLAGYAAVAEGFTKMAFLQAQNAAAQRYSLGFLLGAEAAGAAGLAGENHIEARQVDVSGQAEGQPVWQERLSSLFADDTRLVFCSEATVQSEVLSLARKGSAQVIATGVGTILPQKNVLTVLEQNPQEALFGLLSRWKAGNFPAGEILVAGAENGSVSLAIENGEFAVFTQAAYEALKQQFENGELAEALLQATQPAEDGAFPEPKSLVLQHVSVMLPVPASSASSQPQAAQSAAASSGSGEGTVGAE